MPRKGENIYKRKDNRWEARYIKGRAPDGTARYGYCYAQTYREVKQKVSFARASVKTESSSVSDLKTVRAYSEEWLALIRPTVAESTSVKYASVLNNYILPTFGELLPTAISSVAVGQFSQKLQKDIGLSPKTTRDILSILKTVLKYIAAQTNANLAMLEMYYPKAIRQEIRVLTKEEQERLVRYLLESMDECKLGVLLALMTGLRIGEICALRWKDISAANATISVGATMQRIQNQTSDTAQKTRIVITDPKTENSFRVIPLTKFVFDLCEHWRSTDPMAFVLTGSAQRFIEPRMLQYRLKKYAKECQIENLHFHTLRHSFATRCVEVGFEIKSLSEVLGHANPRITLDLYVHPSLELKRSNMEKLMSIASNPPSENSVKY